MKKWQIIGCGAWLLAAVCAGAQEEQQFFKTTASSGKPTTITADRLTFDYKKKVVLFEKNVVVTDDRMKMTANRLNVNFTETGKAQLIVAQGNVHIVQEDKEAFGNVATYDVALQRISLDGEPRVIRGKDELRGTSITYYRNKDIIICEPGAQLMFYPEQAQNPLQNLGE